VTADSVPFNPNLVRGFISGIVNEVFLFHRLFGLNGITPLHVSYEMLTAMPETVVAWIGRWLGLPTLRFIAPELRVQRQASDVNERWRQQFLGTFGHS
jgi:LPS sulfotransferase NodH